MYKQLVFYTIHRNPWKIRCMDTPLHTLYGKSWYFTWISGFIHQKSAYNFGDKSIFRFWCTSKNQVNYLDFGLWTQREPRKTKVLRISRSCNPIFIYIVLVYRLCSTVVPIYILKFDASSKDMLFWCSFNQTLFYLE